MYETQYIENIWRDAQPNHVHYVQVGDVSERLEWAFSRRVTPKC